VARSCFSGTSTRRKSCGELPVCETRQAAAARNGMTSLVARSARRRLEEAELLGIASKLTRSLTVCRGQSARADAK